MLSEDICKKLTDAAVISFGTNFFTGDIPANAALPAGAIQETGGGAPQETLSDGLSFENTSFWIGVRGEPTEVGDKNARQFIKDIWKVLAGDSNGGMGVANEVINGVMYQNISARHSPRYVGADENNKHLYVANFDVAKEVS